MEHISYRGFHPITPKSHDFPGFNFPSNNQPKPQNIWGRITDLLVMNLDGVGEQHGRDVPGVGARDGDDGRPGQLVEHPRGVGHPE